MHKACTPCSKWGILLMRLTLGAILIAHGWPKLFGDNTELLSFFHSTVLPAPEILLVIAGVIEIFGGALLILGLFTRYLSFLIAIQFLVIVLFVKLKMGWFQFELDLLIMSVAIAFISIGSGALSLDSVLFSKAKDVFHKHAKAPSHAGEPISGDSVKK